MNAILLILIIAIGIICSELFSKNKALNQRLNDLEKELIKIKNYIFKSGIDHKEFIQDFEEVPHKEEEKKEEVPVAAQIPSEKIPSEIKDTSEISPEIEEEITETIETTPHTESEVQSPPSVAFQEETEPIMTLPPKPKEPKEKKHSEWGQQWAKFIKTVNWEHFTGKKLSAWLGGISLFIAAGFFAKYSIDNNLIPLQIRLAIGGLIGIFLIVFSHRLKDEKYITLRHTLISCGIGVIYSIVYGSVYYNVIIKPVGFGLLFLISIAAFVLAVFNRGIAICILGIIGAYATPILVSTGKGNLLMLFLYLAIVNIGVYKVVKVLKSEIILFAATLGTLITMGLAILYRFPEYSGNMIAYSWLLNLILFSLFIYLLKIDPKLSQSIRLSGNLLYLATFALAALLLLKAGWASLLILTVSLLGMMILTFQKKGWYSKFVVFSTINFIVTFIWTMMHFNAKNFSIGLILFLIYGTIGSIGPIFLVKRYGFDSLMIKWFKVFPIAIVLVSLMGFFSRPGQTMWFWPVLLLLQIIGIGITLIISATFQAALLIFLFITGGLYWFLNKTDELIGLGFFGFIFIAAILLTGLIYFLIKESEAIKQYLNFKKPQFVKPTLKFQIKNLEQWLTGLPIFGAFTLLSTAFLIKHPYFPHPGMVTLICFLSLSLFFSKRGGFFPMGIIALFGTMIAQFIWIFQGRSDLNILFSALGWSSFLFIFALLCPILFFKDHKKWKYLINTFALFEAFQAIVILYSAIKYWDNSFIRWLPVALFVLKLPIVAHLLQKLRGEKERNSILAFHGGILLFYFSALPVIVLDYGWIGLTFILEAAALLWLNNRIEHPGLRWVATFMSPIGLSILFYNIPHMKSLESLKILNRAILSVGIAIGALFISLKNSSFPQKLLAKINLSKYYIWLIIGTSFYFINLIISDIFSPSKNIFKFAPGDNFLHAGSILLSWIVFGAILWRMKKLPDLMRKSGIIILFIGSFLLIRFPIIQNKAIAEMKPLMNSALIFFITAMAVMFYIIFKEHKEKGNNVIKNICLALFLISGFMLMKVESSTIFLSGSNFDLFREKTVLKALVSIASSMIYGMGLLIWPKSLDKPFRFSGLILIIIGVVRAFIFPFKYKFDFGQMTPIFNFPSLLFLFVLAALIFLTLRKWNKPWPIKKFPPKPFWGVIFTIALFIFLNYEIASYFGSNGDAFSLKTYNNLSMQLAYSIGWLVFAIGLMICGIKIKNVRVRWASIILLLITSIKIFISDLWRLGQLYRVGSFVGLAVILILVSYLYQKFLTEGKSDEK